MNGRSYKRPHMKISLTYCYEPIARLLAIATLTGCADLPPDIDSVEQGVISCATGSTIKGVDVSHFDGTIDWGAARRDGISFAIIKATEGTSFIDNHFATNWTKTQANGIVHGAYHFFRPESDPVAQADFFVRIAGSPKSGDLPPVIDLEVTDGLTASQVAAGARTFLQRVQQKTGRVPMIYTSVRVFNSLLGTPAGFNPYPLWVANWNVRCPNIPNPPWTRWTFWQSSATGTVAGFSDPVDVDRFNGTAADLMAFVKSPSGLAELASPALGSAFDGDPGAEPSDGGSGRAQAGGSGADMGMPGLHELP
ncbi:MAG TPA: GH25 family lysozyme [Kofleriaceae bacterium]|nr:GH25 family lysozyme [Kofleriaceae bacterium]